MRAGGNSSHKLVVVGTRWREHRHLFYCSLYFYVCSIFSIIKNFFQWQRFWSLLDLSFSSAVPLCDPGEGVSPSLCLLFWSIKGPLWGLAEDSLSPGLNPGQKFDMWKFSFPIFSEGAEDQGRDWGDGRVRVKSQKPWRVQLDLIKVKIRGTVGWEEWAREMLRIMGPLRVCGPTEAQGQGVAKVTQQVGPSTGTYMQLSSLPPWNIPQMRRKLPSNCRGLWHRLSPLKPHNYPPTQLLPLPSLCRQRHYTAPGLTASTSWSFGVWIQGYRFGSPHW